MWNKGGGVSLEVAEGDVLGLDEKRCNVSVDAWLLNSPLYYVVDSGYGFPGTFGGERLSPPTVLSYRGISRTVPLADKG